MYAVTQYQMCIEIMDATKRKKGRTKKEEKKMCISTTQQGANIEDYVHTHRHSRRE